MNGVSKMGKGRKSWEHRLSGQPDALSIDFVESLSIDKRLYKYDIVASIAHAKMLADTKLISKTEFKQIKEGLIAVGEQIATGKFKFDKRLEDIHMAIEAALVKKIGKAGEKLHTARSRNDQVATDIRLWMRDQIEVLQAKITKLQGAFLKLAGQYIENVMPSYTHMQRAQPVVIASYLLSFVEQFHRDFVRLENCGMLVNVLPLGSGAIAGTTMNIDRLNTAKQLGFFDISRNSIDAVSDRDFCAEFIFDCSLIATHLSRLAEDWIIYSSSEFDFINIDDAYCTSSSMMPQKRNPDMLELIRGRTAGVYGSLMAMLTILKALPTGYNRDLQEDKVHVFAAFDSVTASLDMAAAIVGHTKFKTEKISDGLEDGFLDATALAEYLVGKGLSFRAAHGVVGSLVAYCEKVGKRLGELSFAEFRRFSEAIADDVCEYIGAAEVVKRYVSQGSAGPEQAKKQINFWKKRLAER